MEKWLPLIGTLIGTVITVLTFIKTTKRDNNLEYNRRIADAERQTKQHIETTMKLDQILNTHARFEKEIIGLDLRVNDVENRLTKNEAEHESARGKFQRIESILDRR